MDKTEADKSRGGVVQSLQCIAFNTEIKYSILHSCAVKRLHAVVRKGIVRSEWATDDKFSVSSHILGRKVIIIVYQAEKTTEVSAPSHKLWRDRIFIRIASTLFSRNLSGQKVPLMINFQFHYTF